MNGQLDARFSDPAAEPTPWSYADDVLTDAPLYWISTVRSDGRPHVTPLIAVWVEDSVVFTTGSDEQKAVNLAANPHCVVTTGANSLNDGLDVVIEGTVEPVTDEAILRDLAESYVEKYGRTWEFGVADGAFVHDGHRSEVFRVVPAKVLGFAKDTYAQTRWTPAPP